MLFRFANPEYLIVSAVIPILILWYIRKRKGKGASIRFSHVGFAKAVYKPKATRVRHVLFILRMLVLSILIVAFARPQSGIIGEDVITQGIDIILVMDVSSSMLAEDIKPNRLEAAKEVAADFVKGRKNDRMGMVVFSGEAFTQCPLTLDYGILLSFLEQIQVGMIEDGTAIGMGLATAVNRLRTSEAKSKVIILLTDGRNNKGQIDPVTASHAAQAFDIRIYSIGAGTHGTAMYPVNDPFFGKRYVPMPVDIDDEMLKKIAALTGGQYFRATDRSQLAAIYKEIDEMERTKIKVTEYTRYSELFYYLLGLALLLLLSEIGMANTRFRKIP